MLWQSLTRTTLWEDEAFNLTVPLNLIAGLGYTSDGTLSGSTLTPFDARISTGPVVLLPIAAVLAMGVDLVVGARLIPAAFYLALLVGGLDARTPHRRTLGGPARGHGAARVRRRAHLRRPSRASTDILGEMPAAALLAWALVVAAASRPWLAGLLLGLAIQSEVHLAAGRPRASCSPCSVRVPGMPADAPAARRSMLPAVLALVPTVVVELCALIALGPAGFVQHLRATAWLRAHRRAARGRHSTVAEKLATLSESWWLPGALAR